MPGARSFYKDMVSIALSIAVAVLLVRSGLLEHVLSVTQGIAFIESFVAGIFFTSIFTTPTAIVTLGELAQEQPLLLVAGAGSVGAALGDLLIFRFVRDRLSEDILHLFNQKKRERILHIFHKKLFHWLTPLLAALIIASPLPDELAAGMFGVSRVRWRFFLPFSLVANFLGIVIIGALAQNVQ